VHTLSANDVSLRTDNFTFSIVLVSRQILFVNFTTWTSL